MEEKQDPRCADHLYKNKGKKNQTVSITKKSHAELPSSRKTQLLFKLAF